MSACIPLYRVSLTCYPGYRHSSFPGVFVTLEYLSPVLQFQFLSTCCLIRWSRPGGCIKSLDLLLKPALNELYLLLFTDVTELSFMADMGRHPLLGIL